MDDFGVFLEGAPEGRLCFERPAGEGDGDEFLEAAEEVRFAGAEVGGAEEDDAVGAGVDGVEVRDFGGGARFGVGEGSFDDNTA